MAIRHDFWQGFNFFFFILLLASVSCSPVEFLVETSTTALEEQDNGDTEDFFLSIPDPSQPCDSNTGLAEGFYPCSQMDLYATMDFSDISENGADLWGWFDDEEQTPYALMTLSSGTAFVSLRDPNNPKWLAFLPSQDGEDIWRDVKTLDHYAVIVADGDNNQNHGLQVFDLHRLRKMGANTEPEIVSPDATFSVFGYAHNIAVNEESKFAYAIGIQSNFCLSEGLLMIDLNDPLSPQFAGCVEVDASAGAGGPIINPLHDEGDGSEHPEIDDTFAHDAQCVIYKGPDLEHNGKELCFVAVGSVEAVNNTVQVWDVTDKSNPSKLAEIAYPNAGFAHQGWLTEDHSYFLLGDEADETQGLVNQTTTHVLDFVDMETAHYVGAWENPNIQAIDHNLYIVGKHTYQANYSEGIRVIHNHHIHDIHFEEVAFFDTDPASSAAAFRGAWSVFPFFGDDLIIASGYSDSSLYVLKFNNPSAFSF